MRDYSCGKTYWQARSIALALRQGRRVMFVSRLGNEGKWVRRLVHKLLVEQGADPALLDNLETRSAST